MKALVGYTGFVGSNLAMSGSYSALYNSKNISDAFGTKPNLLVFSGIRAEKYLANENPEADRAIVDEAIANIEKISPKSIVLISTVDVYKTPSIVTESSGIITDGLHPYGLHRYLLEQFVSSYRNDHLIVRLPGLYGENIKKNFIYDMIHFFPSMLNEKKIEELGKQYLLQFYQAEDNGFYRLRSLNDAEEKELKMFFDRNHFSALNFTDSRARFQFYNLSYLNDHIEKARSRGIRLLNLACEPCEAKELYKHIYCSDFENALGAIPPNYDMRTDYAVELGGSNGYLLSKGFILDDIKQFVLSHSKSMK